MRASREVIVSGGTVNSPHLLQISGIGPAAHLQSLGVPVVHDLPGVGANLIDHYVVRVVHRVKDAEIDQRGLARPARAAARSLRFACHRPRRAHLRRDHARRSSADSREGLASPDLQLLFTPGSYASA